MPVEDSKSRDTIFDKTGKSAITAVVITELFSVLKSNQITEIGALYGRDQISIRI